MTPKTKKIIAREGLVLFGILAVAAIVTFVSERLGDVSCFFYGFQISFFVYPAYLICRFLIWAVRTLRQK